MDPTITHIILAGLTGFGAGALFSSEPEPEPKPKPEPPPPPPKDPPTGPPTDMPPKPCPRCPPMLGAIVGAGLWVLLGNPGGSADPIAASVLTGLGGGLFGGGFSVFVGLSRSR